MMTLKGYDAEEMQIVTMPEVKTPIFDKVTEEIIQRKMEEWEHASARDNHSARQKGQTPDGRVTAAADKPLQETPPTTQAWKPPPQPRLYK
ncbi:hypothetical protein V5799_007013 [Amblyomma americanum]|uniref:Uncharacterized protein n=1 Tax=Amblyomma americanum TaxID=6943 RepID=A0AAQ4DUR4_AMBAM